MGRVLIIDDEEKIRSLLAKIISLEGFDVVQAGNIKEGLAKLGNFDIDVVICDVKLPDGSGVEATIKIKENYPALEIIQLTAYGNIADGVQAIKNGAFDYITKGDDNNKIIPLLHKAIDKVALAKRVQQLESKLDTKYSFDKIIGNSADLQKSIEAAKKVAASSATVLLTGETGTGKEVFAQAIHQESERKKHHFIAVNCSAFSKELLENELFGHRAGAFTGANKDTKGIFEEANKGTVFLDEIGEMPLDLQAKLLRVLETGEFLKVGDSRPTKIDVRIVAATNRDLLQEIEKGTFREDLYYRIAVFTIKLPALRERIGDIEALARHFLSIFSVKAKKLKKGMSADYLLALKQHNWKGNIRELRNVIERSVILSDTDELSAASLPMDLRKKAVSETISKTLSAFDLASAEKIHIQKVLNYTNGNKTKTAELLNIALTTLYRKMAQFGLE